MQGAFAVITGCVYFICCFGAYSQIGGKYKIGTDRFIDFRSVPMLFRTGVMTLPKAKESGTVAEFSQKAEEITVRNVLICFLVILAAAMVLVHPVLGSAAFVSAFLIFLYYRHTALKYFGGTTGDLSGFFLCLCEAGAAGGDGGTDGGTVLGTPEIMYENYKPAV